MAKLRPIDLPQQSYTPNTRSQTANVDVGFIEFTVRLTRVGWPVNGGADIVTVLVEISFDAGATFPHKAQLTAKGGNLVFNSTGLPINATEMTFSMPQPANVNRRVRVTITNTVTLTSAVSLDISDTPGGSV